METGQLSHDETIASFWPFAAINSPKPVSFSSEFSDFNKLATFMDESN